MNIQWTIRLRVKRAGGLRRLAGQLGIDPGYLCRVMNGTQNAGPMILKAFGVERVVTHRKKGVDTRSNIA